MIYVTIHENRKKVAELPLEKLMELTRAQFKAFMELQIRGLNRSLELEVRDEGSDRQRIPS